MKPRIPPNQPIHCVPQLPQPPIHNRIKKKTEKSVSSIRKLPSMHPAKTAQLFKSKVIRYHVLNHSIPGFQPTWFQNQSFLQKLESRRYRWPHGSSFSTSWASRPSTSYSPWAPLARYATLPNRRSPEAEERLSAYGRQIMSQCKHFAELRWKTGVSLHTLAHALLVWRGCVPSIFLKDVCVFSWHKRSNSWKKLVFCLGCCFNEDWNPQHFDEMRVGMLIYLFIFKVSSIPTDRRSPHNTRTIFLLK